MKDFIVDSFTIGVSRTINLGNFESLRVEASITVDVIVGEGQSFENTKKEAQATLRQLLEETYRNQHADRKHNHERNEPATA